MPFSSPLALPGSPCRSLARTSAFPTGGASSSRSAPIRFAATRCFRYPRSVSALSSPSCAAKCSPLSTVLLRGARVRLEHEPSSSLRRSHHWEGHGSREQLRKTDENDEGHDSREQLRKTDEGDEDDESLEQTQKSEEDRESLQQIQKAEDGEASETFERLEKVEAMASLPSPSLNPFFRPSQLSRNKRRARRPSQPQLVLDAIHGPAAAYYPQISSHKPDLSSPSLAVSPHTVLARYVQAISTSPSGGPTYSFTRTELHVLQSKGYSGEHIKRWASCLLEPSPLIGAQLFQSTEHNPPMFLLLLFLRRQALSTYALSTVMQHLDERLRHNVLDWPVLKLLVIRLTRHARRVWPESIPWISSLFTTELSRICKNTAAARNSYSPLGVDIARFCNAFIELLSLPTTLNPILSSRFQEKAKFEVLKFMADCSPPIGVSKGAFRALTRTQLAHVKTPKEQEWARLKGISWPPWKQSQTAIDEDKGYMYGISRASKIMHRMFEAGFPQGSFETMAEVYAGWDADLSPTIQTRTSLPHISTYRRESERLHFLIWAARVRATRTRREAWACFLAYEASKAPANQDVYHAMFEKLYYPIYTGLDASVLPGDMRETMSEPNSPLGLVYISEPIPTIDQLYHRMIARGLRPTGRVLAFVIQAASDFPLCLDVLQSGAEYESYQLNSLLDGSILQRPTEGQLGVSLPNYLLVAFIRLLCRFGRFSHMPHARPMANIPKDHIAQLHSDPHYRLEYALSILLHLRSCYRPAWTAYMETVLHFPCEQHLQGKRPIKAQYHIMCVLLDKMSEIGIQLDQEQFKVVCATLRHIAQAALTDHLSAREAAHVLSLEPRRLRFLFNTLVKGHLGGSHTTPSRDQKLATRLPPQIPHPLTIHAYVRALAPFRDFEGVYSLSTWVTNHVEEITEVAKAQHSGPRAWRTVLIAMRLALEGKLEKKGRLEPASEELIELVKAQIEGVREWGGWPTDDEMKAYKLKTWV